GMADAVATLPQHRRQCGNTLEYPMLEALGPRRAGVFQNAPRKLFAAKFARAFPSPQFPRLRERRHDQQVGRLSPRARPTRGYGHVRASAPKEQTPPAGPAGPDLSLAHPG